MIVAGSGAAFRTVREGLGFSVPEMAELLRARPREVEIWERSGPPLVAMRRLEELEQDLERLVALGVDTHAARRAVGRRPARVVLVRYDTADAYAGTKHSRAGLPFPMHGAMIARLRAALHRLGTPVEVIWSDQMESQAVHLGRVH